MASDNDNGKLDALAAQVAMEAKELESIPKIPVIQYQPASVGQSGRCCRCGRVSNDLVYQDTFHGTERYVGKECCGGHP